MNTTTALITTIIGIWHSFHLCQILFSPALMFIIPIYLPRSIHSSNLIPGHQRAISCNYQTNDGKCCSGKTILKNLRGGFGVAWICKTSLRTTDNCLINVNPGPTQLNANPFSRRFLSVLLASLQWNLYNGRVKEG